MPPVQSGSHRRELMALALPCLECQDDIQAEVARPFLYLVARRVRAAHKAQVTGIKRSDLSTRLGELQGAAETVLARLDEQETIQALSAIGTVPHGLEKDLAELIDLAEKAPEKLDLKGRHGSDRAAHSFVLHAQPLLALHLIELFEACSGKRPPIKDGRDTNFHELLVLVWEMATGEKREGGWERHISVADRDWKLPKDLANEPVGLTGRGPGSATTFFGAHMEASDLAQDFSECVDRRRQARLRQLPK